MDKKMDVVENHFVKALNKVLYVRTRVGNLMYYEKIKTKEVLDIEKKLDESVIEILDAISVLKNEADQKSDQYVSNHN